jgi:two-component system sensor histidine kinase VicK
MKQIHFFNRIQWKFITIYTLLILIAMQVIGAYFIKSLESHYINNFTRLLDQQAGLLVHSIQNYLSEAEGKGDGESYRDIDSFIEQMVSSPHVEIQVLDQNGIVLSTNIDKQTIIGQRNTQLEVKRALTGTRDETIRIHPKNGHRMKILSLPIKIKGEVVGALYLMGSMEETYQTIKEINNILATGTLIALVFTAGLGIAISRTITSPIKEMKDQATAMADGDFSRMVKVYGQDEIGQLARSFNHLSKRLSTALSENEEEKKKLSSILSYMSDGVIATNHAGRIILMNQRAEQMLNKKEFEVIGTSITKLLSIKDFPIKGRSFEEVQKFLIRLENEDQLQILQVNATPIKREGKKHQGIIAVLQDVTNQEKLEKERKDFVANVSHELRTPLTTMKSYLEALEDGVLHDPTLGPRFIQVIQNETERMIRLVNDLLQLSKIDKKIRLFIQEVDLRVLIEDITDRFSVQLKQRSIRLLLSFDQDLPLVFLDRDQMIQVFDNLLSNAIKYSHDGGNINIKVTQQQSQIQISITDEGVGIPKSDLEHIFQRFYRVDKARSRDMGGTGLGLSIAREMIVAHKGNISIESEYGEGTTVTISLPLIMEEGDEL